MRTGHRFCHTLRERRRLAIRVALWPLRRHLNWRRLWAFSPAGLLAAFIPLAAWLASQSPADAHEFGQWLFHPAGVSNPLQLARSLLNWQVLTVGSKVFWNSLNPTYLFFNDTAPAYAGLFLPSIGVLLLAGVAACRGTRGSAPASIARATLVAVFVSVPLAAAIFREPQATQRLVAMTFVGALLAAGGAEALWRRDGVLGKAVVAVSLLLAIVQFVLALS